MSRLRLPSALVGALLVALLVPLGGCMRAPVHGEVIDQSETFSGTATGYITGRGNLEVVSSAGVACSGTFKYTDGGTHGRGFFTCKDGRDGPFQFTSSGAEGTGYGYLGEARVEFTFGR